MEQIQEDQRIDREQVALARQWLKSANPQQRIEGAEQLGAYPTPEAGRALADCLRGDPRPEVRTAAATSLANFQQPEAVAVSALLSAIQDVQEEVRDAALATLAVYLGFLETESARRKQIDAGLEKLARSRRVDPQTRESLRGLRADR
jgi:HEAT repeat protein